MVSKSVKLSLHGTGASPPAASAGAASLAQVFGNHPRRWRDFTYLYPVVSRRSGGLSIGVNVNVNQACTFDCVYCSVDRAQEPAVTTVDLPRLQSELDRMLEMVETGELWQDSLLAPTPPRYRRLNDIAFSGDGEPTLYRGLDRAVAAAAQVCQARHLHDVKLVLITNATGLDRAPAQRAVATLDRHHGEIWAKLDAGTAAYYQSINRSEIPFAQVLRNVLACGRQRPIVIQTMFMRLHGRQIPQAEFVAYTERLAELLLEGCQIKLVQLYTIARQTRETFAKPINNAQLDHLADLVRTRLPMLDVAVFYKPA